MTHSVYHSFIDLIRVYFKQKQFPSLSSNQFLFALASERTLCRTKCVSCLEFFNSSLWLRFFRISAVTEVEGVLVVNQNGLLGCKSKKMTVIRLLVRSHKNQAQTLTLNNSNEAKATDSLAEISHKCGSLVSTIKTIEQLW